MFCACPIKLLEFCSQINMAMFTGLHGQHSVAWTVPGFTLPTVCIACVIERLENKRELTIHVNKILTELRALLSEGKRCKLMEVLESDKRVLERICGHLFGFLVSQETTIMHLTMEVILTIVNLAQDAALTLKLVHTTVQTVMGSQSFPSSLPHLTFLGKLLHSNPSLCSVLTLSYSSFLEFMIGGLTYPDDSVKSSVVYVLVQLCKKSQPNTLGLPLVQNMCQHVSTNLATAKSQELTINLLGLVRHILRSGTYTQYLLQADKIDSEAKGSTFASAFKRVLLSRDELMQLSAVQCVEEVLLHHMDYGRVLLRADIAEFMFEALSSKNELLISSLFSCLNSLASVEDFYTKCHVLYGIDPVISGLATSMKLRAHTATQTGFSLLRNILTKQPTGMRLFPTHSSLEKMLDVILSGLQVKSETVALHATTLLNILLCSEHLPPGLPLSVFLPPLAVLLHLIEPLTTPTQMGMAKEDVTLTNEQTALMRSDQNKQFCKVLTTFKFFSNLVEVTHKCLGDTNGDFILKDEDLVFFFRALEDSLLPAVLLNMDSVEDAEIFTSLFSMTTSHLSMSGITMANAFARKLVHGGFINLVFEMKMKFLTYEGYKDLCCSGNQFLVSLCFHLEKIDESSSASFIRDTLQMALPSMNCSFESCLQYLNQKAPSMLFQRTPGHVTIDGGAPPLSVLQHATLILLQYAHYQEDNLVSPNNLLRFLCKYLSLNPGIHLLPPIVLVFVIKLFNQASGGRDNANLEWILDATQVLVHGLQRIPDPTQLCIGKHPDLLQWLFDQPSLRTNLAKTWLIQCLWSMSPLHADNKPIAYQLLKVLENSYSARQCSLSLLIGPSDVCIPLDVVLYLLELLLSKESQLKIRCQVIQCLQEMVAMPRVEPIPESSMIGILKLISTALDYSEGMGGSFNKTDLKLVYKVTSLVCKDEVDAKNFTTSVAKHGVDVIRKLLMANKEDVQIPTFLLSNFTFLNKVVSFLSGLTTPKAHSTLSASALHLLSLLVDSQFLHNIRVTQFPELVSLQLSAPLSALSASLREAKIAGLEFWSVIFRREGRTGFLVLENDSADCSPNRLKTVLFLVLNCLISDDDGTRETSCGCLVEVMTYMKKCHHGTSKTGLHWINLTLNYLVETYHTSILPLAYISPILAVLKWMSEPSDCTQLKNLSQLLYKSYLSLDQSPETQSYAASFKACFTEIQRLNSDALDTDQWSTLQIKDKL